jgi:DNA-binding LacI/PurR family transcriptional regulator
LSYRELSCAFEPRLPRKGLWQQKKRKASSQTSATITDVALRAGVSRTAVSYVLNDNGQRNKHVSDEARTKVLQAIQELNFHPDALARALSKGYSEEIVLITGAALTPFAMEFITSLQQQALLYRYTPVMYFSQGFSVEQRRDLHQTIFARRPIGIIASPFNFTIEDVALAREMGVKHIIFIGFHVEPIEGTYSIVGLDHPTGIYAFSDEYAVVLLGALTRLGIRVPQEVAIVGTDNLPISEYVWPFLTSMGFDALDMGKRAVDILHALHHDLPLSEELTRPLVPQLIAREST